ncbi:MAG TPA: hypothetical protein VKV37_17580 [Ktedonobacteraceae bacterium]|nr:hypothetical protein [Ktedonobacteraceae bacterium]
MRHGSYWERHPALLAFLRAFLAGEWVTRTFAWFYMMVSRFAGPTMTIAVGYLMLYAIDSHHGLATPVAHPSAWDSLAVGASGIINVTPELVFPGTVVLAIRALLRRNWLHASLYATASLMFAVLTIMLLNAFMTDGITDSFLSGMLLWRAISALSYTVVAEVCSHHGEVPPDAGVHSAGVQPQLEDLVQQVQSLQGALEGVHQRVQFEVQQALAQLSKPAVNGAQQDASRNVHSLPEQHAVHTYRPQENVHSQSAPSPENAPTTGEGVHSQSAPRKSAPARQKVHPGGEAGKGAQVQQFITEQMAQGNTPTLDDIMDACQCSKHTAIRYHRAIIGETVQERHAPQLRIVQP